jgi:methyl acetate hydrolase
MRAAGGDVLMTPDTVVWIASMTKAVTGAAAMQLVEQGRLSLDAPAAGTLPALGRVQVLDAGALRAPKRPITLRHLLTHTSGFAYDIWNAELGRWMAATGTPGIISCADAALGTPLMRDPGEAWEYGIGIDWAGKMVEAVTGKRLGTQLREALLEPLGMHDTAFRIGAPQRERLAAMHVRGEDGSLTPIPFELPQEPEFEMGGGGLYSTARDYLAFARMLLNDGRHGAMQVLRPETVAEMARDQIAGLPMTPLRTALPASSNDADFFPGAPQGWGLTFLINREASPEGRSPGSLAWAGLGNTYYWIDRTRGTSGVLLTQMLPFFDARVIALFRDFERGVNAG